MFDSFGLRFALLENLFASFLGALLENLFMSFLGALILLDCAKMGPGAAAVGYRGGGGESSLAKSFSVEVEHNVFGHIQCKTH